MTLSNKLKVSSSVHELFEEIRTRNYEVMALQDAPYRGKTSFIQKNSGTMNIKLTTKLLIGLALMIPLIANADSSQKSSEETPTLIQELMWLQEEDNYLATDPSQRDIYIYKIRQLGGMDIKLATELSLGSASLIPYITNADSSISLKELRLIVEELMWLQEEYSFMTTDRSQRNIYTIPGNVSVITAKEIERSSAKNVPDLLRFMAGVNVQSMSWNEKRTAVSVRGFGYNADQNTLLLVDGRRINGSSLFSIDWTGIPLERIDRIEIARGGNSVMYGDKAVSGVINIITKQGSLNREAALGLGSGSYATTKPYAAYSDTTSLLGGIFSYSVNGSFLESAGYRDQETTMIKTAGTGFRFEKQALTMSLSSGIYSSTAERSEGLPEANYILDPQTINPNVLGQSTADDDWYLHFTSGYRLNKSTDLDISVDYAASEFNISKYDKVNYIRKEEDFSVIPQLSTQFDFFDLPNSLTAGIEHVKVTGEIVTKVAGKDVSTDTAQKNTGIYLTDSIALKENSVFADFGLRYDWITDERENLATAKEEIPSFKYGLTWNYAEKSKAFFSYDRSFRTSHFDFQSINAKKRLVDSPQISNQYQLGIAHLWENKGLETKATVFQIDIDDEIILDLKKYRFINYEKTQRQGIELEVDYTINSQWSTKANYTYLKAEYLQGIYDGLPIPNVPKDYGSFTLSYAPIEQLSFTLQSKWQEKILADDDVFHKGNYVDGFVVADLQMNYHLESLNINLALNNIFDEHYAEYGAHHPFFNATFYYPRPDRNISVNLKYKF